jgi:hypothetical protein
VAGLIRVIQWALVGDILYSKSDKARKLAFITVFNIEIIIAYFPTLVPISVVNEF